MRNKSSFGKNPTCPLVYKKKNAFNSFLLLYYGLKMPISTSLRLYVFDTNSFCSPCVLFKTALSDKAKLKEIMIVNICTLYIYICIGVGGKKKRKGKGRVFLFFFAIRAWHQEGCFEGCPLLIKIFHSSLRTIIYLLFILTGNSLAWSSIIFFMQSGISPLQRAGQ